MDHEIDVQLGCFSVIPSDRVRAHQRFAMLIACIPNLKFDIAAVGVLGKAVEARSSKRDAEHIGCQLQFAQHFQDTRR
jgi:hypothetical protein